MEFKEREKQKILIVDDVPINIKMLSMAFRSKYKVSVATNGEDALKIAMSDSPPDLILLDIIIPNGMDGYEVCAHLKADKRTKNIPVIFITAKNQEEDEAKGLAIGAVDYITKPFSLPIVKARAKTHLELKRHRDFLENIAHLDGLTGIMNRRRFDEFLCIEWGRAAQREAPLSLIMIDIDHFKKFNDAHGNPTGDDCLRQVAFVLTRTIRRSSDFVARYGGEEFAAVLPDTKLSEAQRIAETMRREVEELVIHDQSKKRHKISISLGVASMVPPSNSSLETLVSSADRALYEAKKAGRNQVNCIAL